jgi:hypothetical protein
MAGKPDNRTAKVFLGLLKMPEHSVHRAISKLLLGEAFPDVDNFLDEPYRWHDSKGRMLKARHRIYRHSPLTPGVVFMRELLRSGDSSKALKKSLAAVIHIASDKLL